MPLPHATLGCHRAYALARHSPETNFCLRPHFVLPLIPAPQSAILPSDIINNTNSIDMADNKVNINPRYLTYDKDEVQKVLDGAVQMEENDNPMSLVPTD